MNVSCMGRRLAGVGVLAAILATTPTLPASEVLRPSLAKLAAAVVKIMRTRGDESVVVGAFAGPANFGASAGPGIQKILSDELESQGVNVRKFGAPLGVRGEYFYTSAEDDPTSPKQIRLKVVLTDGSGQPLTALNQEVQVPSTGTEGPIGGGGRESSGGGAGGATQVVTIRGGEINLDTFTGGEEAAALLGVTWDFERSGLGFDVNKDIVLDSFQKPTAQIVDGTAVRSSSTSPYFMEVFVGNRPLPLRLEEGQPVVDLPRGENFAIRLTNRARHDVSATLTLDGVNSFAFTKEPPIRGKRLTRYILTPDKWVMVRGWHDTLNTTTAFRVTDFAQGAVARLGASTSSLGMITVVIRSSWMEGSRTPFDEPQSPLVEAAAPPDTFTRGVPLGSAVPTGPFGSAAPGSPSIVAGSAPGADSGFNFGEKGSPSSPAIGFGGTQQSQTQIARGRVTGVVRSIITIRYDR